ncbi:MAG: HD domain-containing protein [Planctomycetes bacterium]|nr:HD domain-containing protein [Planctomycetota bacterium]
MAPLSINLNKLIQSLSLALDLLNPQVSHHHQRVTLISAKIAATMGLGQKESADIFYAAMLHDIGIISSNDKLNVMKFDYATGQIHSEQGNVFLQQCPVFAHLAPLIKSHHDRWLGPNKSGLIKSQIPVISQIICLADRLSVLIADDKYILHQKDVILKKINDFSGTYFNPEVVAAFLKTAHADAFWLDLTSNLMENLISDIAPPGNKTIQLDKLLSISYIFTLVVDSKSHWTKTHSQGMTKLTVLLGKQLGFTDEKVKKLETAALLHDIGKLSIPDEILEKPTVLTAAEYHIIKKHPYYTYHILNQVDGFEDIRQWAAYHHERLDGKGYPFGYNKDNLPLGSRIVAVADIFTALTEDRPYRRKLPPEQAIRLLDQYATAGAIDQDVVNTLKKIGFPLPTT